MAPSVRLRFAVVGCAAVTAATLTPATSASGATDPSVGTGFGSSLEAGSMGEAFGDYLSVTVSESVRTANGWPLRAHTVSTARRMYGVGAGAAVHGAFAARALL